MIIKKFDELRFIQRHGKIKEICFETIGNNLYRLYINGHTIESLPFQPTFKNIMKFFVRLFPIMTNEIDNEKCSNFLNAVLRSKDIKSFCNKMNSFYSKIKFFVK